MVKFETEWQEFRESVNEQEVTEEDVSSYDKLVNEIVSVCKSFTGEHEMN